MQNTIEKPATRSNPAGVVSPPLPAAGVENAEALAAGFNVSNRYGALGVVRHGNFLQWGFSAPPSKMTEAGRNFFLNCVCYIAKFDGKRP